MKGFEKFIILAVFVVPIVICVVILKNIWKEDEEKVVANNYASETIVSVDNEIVYQSGDEFLTEDQVNNSNTSSGSTTVIANENKPTQISKLFEGVEVSIALADVYSSPDASSERIGTITRNTKITAQQYSNGWSKISGTDSKGVGVSGWMKTDNITFPKVDNSELNIQPNLPTGVVTAEPYLNVRLNPSSTAEIIAKINKGERITIQESTNGWHKVTVNGHTGWVSSAYVK